MTDLGNIETAAKAEVTAEVASLKTRALNFVKTYGPKLGYIALSYAAGHFGWIGAVLKVLI